MASRVKAVFSIASLLILCVVSIGLAAGAPALAPESEQQALAQDDNVPPIEAEQGIKEDEDYLYDEGDEESATVPDPLEKPNRKIFSFNDKFYFDVAEPLARGWAKILPQDFRIGIRNFIYNFYTPIRFGNCLLQANPKGAVIEFVRAVLNTFFGIGGLYDVAGIACNLPRQPEDFGQTLGVWGVSEEFFIEWPFVGPSTFRSSVGLGGDAFMHPLSYTAFWWLAFIEYPFNALNELSLNLGEYESIKKAALDPYVAIREAYVQYRRQLVKQRGVEPVRIQQDVK